MIRSITILIDFLNAWVAALVAIRARWIAVQEKTRRGEDTEPRH